MENEAEREGEGDGVGEREKGRESRREREKAGREQQHVVLYEKARSKRDMYSSLKTPFSNYR